VVDEKLSRSGKNNLCLLTVGPYVAIGKDGGLSLKAEMVIRIQRGIQRGGSSLHGGCRKDGSWN